MENLSEIKGFITYSDEEKKEKKEEPKKEEEESEDGEKTITQLKKEAGDTILNAQGEDIMEKFTDKVLKEFLPC